MKGLAFLVVGMMVALASIANAQTTLSPGTYRLAPGTSLLVPNMPSSLLSLGATVVVPTPAAASNVLSVAMSGSGTITSAPTGIACPSTCTASFNAITAVTLTASAASTHSFAGWSGACSGTGQCAVTMNRAVSVGATFVAHAPLGSVLDNFNRTNGSLNGNQFSDGSGMTWVTIGGDWNIDGKAATNRADHTQGQTVIGTNLSSSAHYVMADVRIVSVGDYSYMVGLDYRGTSDGRTHYRVLLQPTAKALYLQRYVDGVGTNIASVSIALTHQSTYRLYVEVDASDRHTVKIDGMTFLTLTDRSMTSGLRTGMYDRQASASGGQSLDNFTTGAGSLSNGGVPAVVLKGPASPPYTFVFRDSFFYASDAPDTFVDLGYPYPHTYVNTLGKTVIAGWVASGQPDVNHRCPPCPVMADDDRTAADSRLAGYARYLDNMPPIGFRIDGLPAGSYNINLAVGLWHLDHAPVPYGALYDGAVLADGRSQILTLHKKPCAGLIAVPPGQFIGPAGVPTSYALGDVWHEPAVNRWVTSGTLMLWLPDKTDPDPACQALPNYWSPNGPYPYYNESTTINFLQLDLAH